MVQDRYEREGIVQENGPDRVQTPKDRPASRGYPPQKPKAIIDLTGDDSNNETSRMPRRPKVNAQSRSQSKDVIELSSDSDDTRLSNKTSTFLRKSATRPPPRTAAQRAWLNQILIPRQDQATPARHDSGSKPESASAKGRAPTTNINTPSPSSFSRRSPNLPPNDKAASSSRRTSAGCKERANKISTPATLPTSRTDSEVPVALSKPVAKSSTTLRSTPTPLTIPIRQSPTQASSPKVIARSSPRPRDSFRTRSTSIDKQVRSELGQDSNEGRGPAASKLHPETKPESPVTEMGQQSGKPERSDDANFVATKSKTRGSEQLVLSNSLSSRPPASTMRKSAPSGPGAGPKVTRLKASPINTAPLDPNRFPEPVNDLQRSQVEGFSRPLGNSPPTLSISAVTTFTSHLSSTRTRQNNGAPQATRQGDHQLTRLPGHPSITIPRNINAEDLESTVAIVDDCLKKHLKEVHDSHEYVVTEILRRQRTCFEREARLKDRLPPRDSTLTSIIAEKFIQNTSPFKKMQPIHLVTSQKGGNGKLPCFSQELFSKSRMKDGVKSRMTVPITQFQSTAVNVPAFREYVSLQDNVLAENEKTLLNWPYFPDGVVRQDMEDDLKRHYKMKNEIQPEHDLLSDVHRFYGASVDAFLEDLGVVWQDILYWHLASSSDIKRINNALNTSGSADFEKVLLNRKPYLADEFDRNKPKWKNFLLLLSQPSSLSLRLAALASSSFSKQVDFKLWHLARRSVFRHEEISNNLEGKTDGSAFQYRTAMCRVCQLHNCPFHGELRERPEADLILMDSQKSNNNMTTLGGSDSEYTSSDNEAAAKKDIPELDGASFSSETPEILDDSDIEDVVNYRRAVNTHTLPPYEGSNKYNQPVKPPIGEFKAKWWLQNTNTASWEHRKPFYPCDHEGTCDQAQCRCFREGITCEKSCGCSLSCRRRFPGCSCSQIPGKRLCGTDKCLCQQLRRECDADLCGTCGATEILDRVNRHSERIIGGRCCNVTIQRGVPKKTLLGHSEVHGFGLYTGEDVKKDDFLGEYKGEVITLDEGFRRGIIYEKQQTMYLFRLNQEQEIDSTHVGNKTRFINNADPKFTNCYTKNMLCNTVHRIGMYASTDIKAGTELFFDYGYPKQQTKHFKQPGGKQGNGASRLVTVKRRVKPNSSSSTLYKSQSLPSLNEPGRRHNSKRSTPERRKQTEPARAARLAKKFGQSQTTTEGASSAGVPQLARKSAPNSSTGLRGVVNRRNVHALDKNQIPSTNTTLSHKSHEVQESDSEDVYGSDDVEEEYDDAVGGSQVPVSDDDRDADAASSDEDGSSAGIGLRQRTMAPLVAVRERSWRRSGAGRKRKRFSMGG